MIFVGSLVNSSFELNQMLISG